MAASTAPSKNSKRISANTSIVVITEFGCTARINGTVGSGSWHRHRGACWWTGRSRSRVIAGRPGLKPAQLYEARDLAPTTEVRAVLKDLLACQFGLSTAVLGDKVFQPRRGEADGQSRRVRAGRRPRRDDDVG
ncbi:hypothetical protein [Mesorhizobium qingshengii]|uniref:hypothetical protein n=1 Tax=Mesorhizobium qingshengii TaxID=1165689 RepID=UPI003CC7AE1E